MRLILRTITFVLISAYFEFTQCQLNGVKPGLVHCYNVSAIPGIIVANNRPPATLNIFLEILRRLEDANPDVTVRDLSTLLVHRLKQNGIASSYNGRVVDYNIAIPFAPTLQEAIKGTVIAEVFLPNSSLELKYGEIDMSDICAFHYMISNTVNTTVREDESQTCVRSSRYQMRIRREAGEREEDTDTERIEKISPRQSINPTTAEISECPVELGVIYTNYGTIKAGQVLQGMAAGMNKENEKADNRYAATLTGDLAHVGLIQMQPPLIIGAQGGWNSTINPKYFFLQKKNNIELSDQDIRGSLDGLFLGLKLDEIRSTFTDIKLSQIIDMYYSPYQKGIFDSTFRACNRNILYTELVTSTILKEEIYKVLIPLDQNGPYPGTIVEQGYGTLSEAALNNFTSYLPQIVDLACPQADSDIERASTDILIFIDGNHKYNTIQPIISYILDSIDVNKFGSRFTVFGPGGVNITNSSSRFLLDFHKQYNLSIHENIKGEFDYAEVYKVIESTVKSKLNNNTYAGGESTVSLLLPRSKPNDNQNSILNQRKEIFRQFLPDLSVIVLGSGTSEDYSSLLFNPSKDFISLPESTNENDLKNVGQNVIDKIKTIPRSIVNPSCGASWSGSSATFTLTDYVDLYGRNYYKISPNYFQKGDGNRHLKITVGSTGTINVCLSRDQSRPTHQTGDCESLNSSVKDYDITDWCGGSTIQDCAPIYFSVYGNTSRIQCYDVLCRFPNNIKYSISLENAGCASSATGVVSSFVLVSILFLFLRF